MHFIDAFGLNVTNFSLQRFCLSDAMIGAEKIGRATGKKSSKGLINEITAKV